MKTEQANQMATSPRSSIFTLDQKEMGASEAKAGDEDFDLSFPKRSLMPCPPVLYFFSASCFRFLLLPLLFYALVCCQNSGK